MQAKIAYVIGSLACGGAERQLLELLRRLDRSRFSPHLVLFNGATASQADGLVETVLNLGLSSGSNSQWQSKLGRFSRAIYRLAAFFRQTQPDIVQAILPAATILTGAAAAVAPVAHLVGCRRSLVDAYRTTKLVSAVEQTINRRFDVMVGNSGAIVRELVELDGIAPERALCIPNGIDTGRFCPGTTVMRQSFGWTDDNLVLGIVANFLPYKRHVDFIDAAERILRGKPNARFLMVGNYGGELATVKDLLNKKGLEGVFRVVPGSTEPENLYRAMDIYVCSSQTEGLSNVLLEAAATGLPIVATDVGGNPEIVRDGYNGLLIPAHDPEAIAAAALRLADDAILREQMGARGRERAVSDFSIQSMVTGYEELYEKLLARGRSRQADPERSVSIATLS